MPPSVKHEFNEPMIDLGGYGVKIHNDGWTAVTETGCEIFTQSPKGLDKPPYGQGRLEAPI